MYDITEEEIAAVLALSQGERHKLSKAKAKKLQKKGAVNQPGIERFGPWSDELWKKTGGELELTVDGVLIARIHWIPGPVHEFVNRELLEDKEAEHKQFKHHVKAILDAYQISAGTLSDALGLYPGDGEEAKSTVEKYWDRDILPDRRIRMLVNLIAHGDIELRVVGPQKKLMPFVPGGET